MPRLLPAAFLSLSLALIGLGTSALAKDIAPPVAQAVPHERKVNGDVFQDDYFWLRDRKNPEVVKYLEAENAYMTAQMEHTQALRDKLFAEIKSRIKETDLSVPYRLDDYFYYRRTVAGKQYSIHCRKKGSLEGTEEILLDENELAEGQKYFSAGVVDVSPNHALLAYAIDTDGSEKYTLRFKDLTTGKILPDEIKDISSSVSWAADNKTVFYTILDEAHRPFKVLRHTLGTDAATDPLIFHEKDDRFFVGLGESRSRKYLVIGVSSQVTSENWILESDKPNEPFRLVQAREQGVEYSIEHHDDRFFIVTNDNAVNYKLMVTPVATPSKEHWTEFLPYDPAVKIGNIEAFEKHLVLFDRKEGQQRLRVIDLETNKQHQVEFPEPVYTVSGATNPEFKTRTFRLVYASMVTPNSVFDYNMDDRTRELKKREEVKGYDPSQYESQRLFATAADGTKIPMSLVMKKGLPRDGKRPLLLYGYGSYGASMDPWFSSGRISLLDRGVIFVIAHIRGGSEMGRPWYDDGKLLKKKNTFTDFIACAEHLVKEKYTSPDKLAIMGGSAGGLLMGAVTNMRPDLFHAVVAQVPFVDVINTMLDATLPLTVPEYEEWGNPEEKEYYDYIRSYSPYDNVEKKAYPQMLITAGLNDPRVQYWEPAKWVARLRKFNTSKNRLLLKTNMGAGHGGESGRYDHIKEIAFEYAFLLDAWGIKE